MKIIDISQEVFGCEVYPGDSAPERIEEMRISGGAEYNLTSLRMCAHNGTHVDAPFHFFENGKTVDEIPLEKTVGYCFVAEQSGTITAEIAEKIIATAKDVNLQSAKKILIKGDVTVTEPSARVFAKHGLDLLGVESQTVGYIDTPKTLHEILLGKEIVLLEGLRLNKAQEGVYFLNSAPLSLSKSDGSPCRAYLIEI